jgi:putative transcriptional regulator
LNNRVRELREAAGLTQAALAQLTGVSRQTINAIETGKYDPSI